MNNIDYENLKGLNAPFREEYIKKYTEILDKGWFILGSEVEQFEKEFAEYLGVPYFLGLASGLDALELPLKAFDFEPGSEVIVPSNTYIATINAILNTGHKPVFVEPDINTYNINPARIEEKINSKTKAIMVVHLYGKSCDMDPILELCKKYNLELIEDCAQSHGALYKGKMTGTFGIGAFSFYPTKNLGALGDAGGIALQDEKLYQKLKAWRNYGSYVKYKNEYIGDNSRLDEIQAGFLRIKLKALNDINNHKRSLAEIYFNELNASKYILPARDKNYFDVYHIFSLRSERRDTLKQELLELGIKTEIHYPIAPIDQNSIKSAFESRAWKLEDKDFEIAREIHATELSLPISTIHNEEQIQYICKVMNAL